MQQRDINKDCRVLFGDIFIVPSLGPALGYLTAIIFFSLNITIARDSISGVTRFACTNMGSCSVSAYSIHVTVVGFGSAFVNI